MLSELKEENALLRQEIRVLHEAAELTANLVIEQFKQTEREKYRFQEAAANLEGFKRTLDQTSDCVFMFDPQTLLFTYVNQGGVNHTGYSEAELFTMSFANLGSTFTREQLAQKLAPLIEDSRESLLLETTHKRKNGVDVPVEIFVQYIAPTGIQGRFFSIVRNISKRLLEEKEKEQMQTKMLHTQKLESVGELAAGIAHEINTPIQYIGTNLSFLEEAFADITTLIEHYHGLLRAVKQQQATQQHIDQVEACREDIDLDYLTQEFPQAIHQANDGVKRVSKLVMAMKDFSQPGSKEKELTDINKIIHTTVQISRNEWKYCADVELELAENLPLVHCHPNDIGQVMLNLLLNAAHSIKERLERAPNTPKGSIVIRTTSSPKDLTMTITDNGCGIADNILNKIFDPFFTTKEVGKGTGQGLAIARDVILNKHGGDIEVTSEPGLGSTFTIHMPRSRK